MSRYKYYFRKPKSEIVKDVFNWLSIAGVVCVAATSPYFITNTVSAFKNKSKYKKKNISDTFYNLRKQGYLGIEEKNHQAYIFLTEKGKKAAGRFQIDSLKINKPRRWDQKWRIVIFDIVQMKNLQRNVFRGKLKELGFIPLQKSVWIYPYPCKDEIGLLREFFGLSQKEIRLITADDIENDDFLRKTFDL